MFVLSQFIRAIAGVIEVVLQIYLWIVIISALLSWVNPDPYNPIIRFLYAMTEPVYRIIRRILPLPRMAIDFSPVIVILIIIVLQSILHQIAVNLQ